MAELGRARKRSREEEEEEETPTDIHHLPDSIFHHILSLLDDTKSAVQTCVSSPLLRSAWKHVPILKLDRASFQDYSRFCRFADEVLSHRNPFIDAPKISYTDKESFEHRDRRLLIRVIKYAASHGTQHLVIDLHTVLADHEQEMFRFSECFAPVLDSNLKTLELKGMVALDSGMGSPGFRNVTTLDMDSCLLACDEDSDPDPFSHFPCLENLILKKCTNGSVFYHRRNLRISGLRLLSLKLVKMDDCEIEVSAPKLKFFSLWSNWRLAGFTGFNLPSLEHACIQVYDFVSDEGGRKELVERHLVSLFRGLRNAKTLTLHYWTISLLSEFYKSLDQPSPFKRLESLIVDGESILCQLSYYFLKGDNKTAFPPGLSILRICPEAEAHRLMELEMAESWAA